MENIHLNSVVLKVHNGTQNSGGSLCLTCRNALHIEASRSGAETLVCLATPPPGIRITEPVGRCTGYLDRSKPTLWDMQQIAWQLMTDKGGRKIGFCSPEEMQRRSGGQPPSQP